MRVVALFALVALGCGPRTTRPAQTGDVPWASSGIDWSKPPVPREIAWTAPSIAEAKLANGIRVLVVENHRLPLVAISVLHHAAGSRGDGAKLGLAALTVDLLDEGGGELGAAAFVRALDRYGARLEGSIATDHATQQLVARSRELPRTIDLLAASVRRPRFDAPDVVRVRDARVTELNAQRGQTRRIAAQVFDRVVFGSHPYAQPAEGTRATMSALTLADVRGFWERAYRPDAMTVIAAGDVTLADLRTQLERAFGDWAAPSTPLEAVPALPTYSTQFVYVDVPGATETNVIVGHRAPGSGVGDTLPAELANTILGSGVDGRLDRELHGKRGLTFGASSGFWRGEAGGSWSAAATFSTKNTGTGLTAMFEVFEATRTREPTDEELARARRNMLAGAQASFETTATTARAVERLITQRRPLDTYATLASRLGAVSKTAVRDAFPWTELSIVAVGDWSAISGSIITPGPQPTPYVP